ncbi:MAG: phospho-N-acetylmuramoyl-pentapeptide-transferase [Candidatus Tectomicrobia bacterium]|nr:phospho-N-acetylmuramoyl-pentapeptide-transferase [Candidatus Tectomicrobia bacterium]
MLYLLLAPLKDVHVFFNLFRYITLRTAFAVLTGLLISFVVGPRLIRFLKRLQPQQAVREDVPERHRSKAGTPTMGGLLILLALVFPTLLWADLTHPYVWLTLLATLAFGAIGFADDYLKIRRNRGRGIRAYQKFLAQVVVGAAIGLFLLYDPVNREIGGRVAVPFFKSVFPYLGLWYVPFVFIVVAGTSNAVNLTDGLDGLALGPVLVATMAFLLFSYVAGNVRFSRYLQVTSVPGAGELVVFCGAMVGASLGFLWFNAYPAQVFMGDVGALALGGALGTIAVITRQEAALVIAGGLFVLEAISVILQVLSFKLTGRRIFRMAPLHHHFELKGWEEPKVVVRFFIISVILSLFSLSTLKLR